MRKIKLVAIFTVICALVAFTGVFFNFLLPLFLALRLGINTKEAASIGIIGSADGPTAIFISGRISPHWFTVVFAALTLIGVIYLLFAKKSVKK